MSPGRSKASGYALTVCPKTTTGRRVQLSFADHYDFHPDTEEDWNHGISTPAARTDLSWLAEVEADPETIAGFCHLLGIRR